MAVSLRLACLAAFLETSPCLPSEPWEWAGVYDFPAPAHYVWSAARNAQGQYAHPGTKVVVVVASAASDAGLHGAEVRAQALWNGPATLVRSGGEIGAMDAASSLVFDQRIWVSHFELHVDEPGAYAIFAEHSPTEFERGFHFLRTESGANVEAVAQESSAPCPWTEAWEWSGVFPLVAGGYYSWNAARGPSGSYADRNMKLVIVAAPNATAAGLAGTTADAQALWNSTTPVAKSSGDVLHVGGAYTLTFDDRSWVSHFLVDASARGPAAFYAQHVPTEFAKDFHYLKSSSGADVEPAAETSAAACGGSQARATPAPTAAAGASWGDVLAGAFVTCLPSLLGFLFVVPQMASRVKEVFDGCAGVINTFASAVIFAAAVFLLLPEALQLAGSGHSEEVVGTWTWGTCVLAGWLTCFAIAGVSKAVGTSLGARDALTEPEPPAVAGKPVVSWSSRIATAAPVLLGDFFHNFADGLVIGVAFKVCGVSFGWRLVGVTVAHEVPQELADLVILILDAKMKWHWATLANFLGSLSTIVGAIITYSSQVGPNQQGLVLAYGAGVYLFVAITELGGHILHPKGVDRGLFAQFMLQFLAFVFGCVLMGLVLLGHVHCTAPAAGGAAAPAASGGHHDHGHQH